MTKQSKCHHCGNWVEPKHDMTAGYYYPSYCDPCNYELDSVLLGLRKAQDAYIEQFDKYPHELRNDKA